MHDVKKFFSNEPYLCRSCADGIIRHCALKVEMLGVLNACHTSPVGGNLSCIRTAQKTLHC